jgi:hypothetical protein
MSVHVAREQGERLDEALAELVASEPYLPYANFDPIGPERARRLHERRWRAESGGLGVLVARDDGGRPLAAICLEHRDFESRHFGLTMAKIEPAMAVEPEPARIAALRALYARAAADLQSAGYQHLAAIASTHDRIGCWALQELGAFHVGTKISWMQTLDGRPRQQHLPAHLRIETFDKTTFGKLDPASWRRLHEWTGQAFDRGPFVFDLNVPRERAAAVYQVWTQKALCGEWADVLLVVRDRDEVVAFHSMMLLEDLSEAAGVGVVGRGIGASLPGYRGLFTALQQECAASRPLGAGFLENETQASTVQSINVFGKLGHRCLRSMASFHLCLDRRVRRELWRERRTDSQGY